MIASVTITVLFDRGASKCELEYLLVDHLASVANQLFDSFIVSEFWPQVGLSNSQFILKGADTLPDNEETAAFEAVVANYLTNALGRNATQPISSVCVDVVNTDFVEDGEQSQAAVVTARSAPFEPEPESPIRSKHHTPRPRSGNEEDAQVPGSTYHGNEATTMGTAGTAAHSTGLIDDVFERHDANEAEIISPKRMPRPRSNGEGYSNTGTMVYESTAGRASFRSVNEMPIAPHTRHGPRPRRGLENEGAVMFDTVVTGRYRGPKIDMDKKVNDAISGNEYEIAEELEKEQPDYFSFDEEQLRLTLVAPSTTPSPTASAPIPVVSIDTDEPEGNWKGLIGFFILGLSFIVLIVGE